MVVARPGLRVLLDTNQWFSSLLLRTPTGAAVLHLLGRAQGALAVPDVVEQELRAKLVERGSKAAQAVQSGMADIQRLLGSVREWQVPDRDQFATAISERLHELDALVDHIALTHDHTLVALDRVVRGVRPTVGDKEEFRDQLIWQSVLEIARNGYEVIFVTADGGFFESGKAGGALATPMLDDIDGLSVHVVTNLEQCLDLVAEAAPPIDREVIMGALLSATSDRLTEVAEKHEFHLGELRASTLKIYATERSDVAAVVFGIEYEVHGGNAADLLSPTAYIQGTAFFDASAGAVTECRPERFGLRWVDEQGNEVGHQNVVLGVASLSFGPREMPWTVRKELPGWST